MSNARWLSPLEASAWNAVRDLGQPLWTALGRDLQVESGLSMADYQVLVVLSESPAGELAYRELQRQTGWEKSRLSHHITRMARRDLVERIDCSDDGRSATIVLTAEGRNAIRAAAPGHVASVRRYLIDVLTPKQLAVLTDVAAAVRAAVRAAEACGAEQSVYPNAEPTRPSAASSSR